jgi:hypothetical protein
MQAIYPQRKPRAFRNVVRDVSHSEKDAAQPVPYDNDDYDELGQLERGHQRRELLFVALPSRVMGEQGRHNGVSVQLHCVCVYLDHSVDAGKAQQLEQPQHP